MSWRSYIFAILAVVGLARRFEEELYRFEFPERPGALMNFLTQLPHDWNISLFHYRNHGAAYGRVLVGMQVPSSDQTHVQSTWMRLATVIGGRVITQPIDSSWRKEL